MLSSSAYAFSTGGRYVLRTTFWNCFFWNVVILQSCKYTQNDCIAVKFVFLDERASVGVSSNHSRYARKCLVVKCAGARGDCSCVFKNANNLLNWIWYNFRVFADRCPAMKSSAASSHAAHAGFGRAAASVMGRRRVALDQKHGHHVRRSAGRKRRDENAAGSIMMTKRRTGISTRSRTDCTIEAWLRRRVTCT